MAEDHRLFPLSALTPEQRAVLDALATSEGLHASDYSIQIANDGRLVTYSDDEGEVLLED